MTKILVADLRPNPFRSLEHYPINAEKVEALVNSIKSTEFWDNLLVRKAPDGNGYEQAYGHHRVVALKKARITEIDVPVRNLDDTKMAQIMAQENMEEWGHSAAVEQETIRTIVAAYGEGRINMPAIRRNGNGVRFAPSFVLGSDSNSSMSLAYTIDSLVEFLGWKAYKVKAAIEALALIEQNVASTETFNGLSSRQALAVTHEASRVLRETKSTTTARGVARGLSAGFQRAEGTRRTNAPVVTIHSARRVADDLAGPRRLPAQRRLPNFDKFIDGIAKATGWYFENKRAQWDAVIQFKDEMPREQRHRLVAALKSMIKQCERMITKLEA